VTVRRPDPRIGRLGSENFFPGHGGSRSSPAIADVNGDGVLEIVATDGDGTRYVFEPGGSMYPGFPFTYGGLSVLSSPAVIDVDGDGLAEIFLQYVPVPYAFTQVVNGWTLDGSALPGFPKTLISGTDLATATSIHIADADGDGDYELATGAAQSGGGVTWVLPIANSQVTRAAEANGWPRIHHDPRNRGCRCTDSQPHGNHRPVARTGGDVNVECAGAGGAEVALDGSASSDADSTPGTNDDIVAFDWFENYGVPSRTALGAGQRLQVTFATGVHRVTLRVTDHAGATAVASVAVTVQGPPNRDDGNPCTADAVNPICGCDHVPLSGVACDDGNLGTTGDVCTGGVCIGSSHLNEPHPRTVGYYRRLCQNDHSGDALTTADARCVADTTATFDTHTVADLCAIISRRDGGDDHGDDHTGWGSGSHNTYCDKARAELVALALNRCRARACDAQRIVAEWTSPDASSTVGASFASVDATLAGATQITPAAVCKDARCLAKEINRGRAFIIDDLRCDRDDQRQHGGVSCRRSIPRYNDDTEAPKSFGVYRRPHGAGAFAKVATVNRATYSVDDPSDDFDYDVVPVP
jgi:hypothetical protein